MASELEEVVDLLREIRDLLAARPAQPTAGPDTTVVTGD